MRAHAAVVAELVDGVDRCTTLRSDPPLTLRQCGGGEVRLVGSAAGPLGGDDLALDIEVRAGASLALATVAASLVHPSPVPAISHMTIRATVAGQLRWTPEPMVLVRGCDHRVTITVALEPEATLLWAEEVMLGRWGERSGSLFQRLRVDRGGRPLIRADLALGPAWPGSDGPAGIGGALAVATVVLVGPAAADLVLPKLDGVRSAVLRLAEDAVVISALADRPGQCRALTAALLALVSQPVSPATRQ
ncbi:MAG: urease accessory protein UreD [Acidimicrobiia bacterium]|nr:urease accessory protein UreD [Acidimicrobiia bacterium]